MKYLSVILCFSLALSLNAQYPGYSIRGSSADQIVDAKSMALGESSVANPVSPYSFIYNPANLSGIKETSVFFNRRSNNWFVESSINEYCYSTGIAALTSVGNFMFAYSRNNFVIQKWDYYKDFDFYDYTFSFGYSGEIIRNLFLGGIIKTWKLRNYYLRPEITLSQKTVRDLNLLADFGLLYKINKPFIKGESGFADRLYFGASIQNIGADISIQNDITTSKREMTENNYAMAKYLRLGLSYGVIIPTKLNANTIELILSGEYKNQINALESEKKSADSYGIGLETKFLDLISLNLGGVIKNGESPFYESGEINLYYGFSLNLPMKYISASLPFKLGFDYGIMTVKDKMPFGGNSVPAYNVTISYDGKLF